jgi:hypothetical protein
MYLRIVFLALLCVPVLYIVFILTGYLVDEIIRKEHKRSTIHRKQDYEEDDIYREYQKRRGNFKVIR